MKGDLPFIPGSPNMAKNCLNKGPRTRDQLKDLKAFDRAGYNALVEDAETTLSSDLVAKKVIQVRPLQTATVTMPMDEAAQYVAIVAQYRMPDIRKRRLVTPSQTALANGIGLRALAYVSPATA